MNKLKEETWLPIFPGFYESCFDGSDSIIEGETDLDESEYKERYRKLYKKGVSLEFFKKTFWDYTDFSKCYDEASEMICDGLIELNHNDIILGITYQKTVSPKEYNFTNDSIDCEIEVDVNKLNKYLKDHLKEFTKYIALTYTSYDGFSSSYSNDVNDWLNVSEYGSHQLGSVLNFVIENNEGDEVSLKLLDESNCEDAFYNYKYDYEKCIEDFKKGVKA